MRPKQKILHIDVGLNLYTTINAMAKANNLSKSRVGRFLIEVGLIHYQNKPDGYLLTEIMGKKYQIPYADDRPSPNDND